MTAGSENFHAAPAKAAEHVEKSAVTVGQDPWAGARSDAYSGKNFAKHETLAWTGTDLAQSFTAAKPLFSADGKTMDIPPLV
jgi:hypothetical protein